MQFNLLQDDLFSTAGESLAPAPSKKSKSASAKLATKQADKVEPIALATKAPEPISLASMLEEPQKPAAPAAAAPVAEPVVVAAPTVAIVEKTAAQPTEEKAPNAFKTISEVAEFLGLPQHVLRFWESRFSQIKPLKMRGGRRYYRPDDIEVLTTIKHLLYKQGYTINGAKKAFSQGKHALIQTIHMQEALDAPDAPPAKAAPPKVTDKQKAQLTAIRQELYALRETLRPYTQ